MPHTIQRMVAQQIVEAVKDVCNHDINFIDTKSFFSVVTKGMTIFALYPSVHEYPSSA